MPPLLADFINSVGGNGIDNLELIVIAYLGLLWLSILIWVTRDVISRSTSLLFQAFSILLAITIPVLGVLIYLIIRPGKTQMQRYHEQLEAELLENENDNEEEDELQCDKCFIGIEPDYNICPNCSFQLKKSCYHCRKHYSKQWDQCPYCGKLYREKVTKAKRTRKMIKKENIDQ